MNFKEVCLKVKSLFLDSPKSVYDEAGIFCLGNQTRPNSEKGDFFHVYCGNTMEMAQALAKAMMDDDGSKIMIPVVRAAVCCFIDCASSDDILELFGRPAFEGKKSMMSLLTERFEKISMELKQKNEREG